MDQEKDLQRVPSLAVGEEVRDIRKEFTIEEHSEHKTRFAKISGSIRDVELEKAESNSEYNQQLKELKKEHGALLTMIEDRSVVLSMTCYKVPDYEKRTMNFVDKETGEVVDSRRLYPDEAQLEAFPGNHTAAEGGS